MRASGRDACYVRPLAFFGGETVRLDPGRECPVHVMIAVLPFDGIMPGDGVPQFRATVSPFMKTPSRALPSTVKAGGHYTNSIRALADAHARGFDEALLRNDRGDVAEGSGENVFVVRDGVLITNDADADILPGITRASTLALAREAGITTRVRPLTTDDLARATKRSSPAPPRSSCRSCASTTAISVRRARSRSACAPRTPTSCAAGAPRPGRG